MYVCSFCNKEITNSVCRIDGGELFHLHCFKLATMGKNGIKSCPECFSTGVNHEGKKCDFCKGSGYID
jgi:hypothetical protein